MVMAPLTFPQNTAMNPSREVLIQTPSAQVHVPQRAKLRKMWYIQGYHCLRATLADYNSLIHRTGRDGYFLGWNKQMISYR